MKAFSVVFRDIATDQLYAGVVNQEELAKLVCCTSVKVCCCHEIWREV